MKYGDLVITIHSLIINIIVKARKDWTFIVGRDRGALKSGGSD